MRGAERSPAPAPAPAAARCAGHTSDSRHALHTHSGLGTVRHNLISVRLHITTMAAKIVIVLACLALSHASVVKREAPTPLQELQKHAKEFGETFTQQFNAITTSKDSQAMQKALKDGTDSVFAQITAFSNSLQGAISDANGKAKEALEETRVNLQKTADELRKAHPEVEQQATALKEKLSTAVQNAVLESQKLAKVIGDNVEQTNQKLAPKLKTAYDDFVKQAQAVQKNISEAVNKPQ